MSPNWSVSRNMLPCLRTWTLPRSVAFAIGISRGSMMTTPSSEEAAAARAWAFAPYPAAARAAFVSCAIVASGLRREPFGLVRHDQRVDQPVDLAGHDPRQRRQVHADPVVCQPI